MPCHLCLFLPCGLLFLCFPTKMFMHVSSPRAVQLCDLCIDHLDSNLWEVRIILFSTFYDFFLTSFVINNAKSGRCVKGTGPALAVGDWRNPWNSRSWKHRMKPWAFRVRSRNAVQASPEWSPEDHACTVHFVVVVYVNAPGVIEWFLSVSRFVAVSEESDANKN
jgi:hypothetical protein